MASVLRTLISLSLGITAAGLTFPSKAEMRNFEVKAALATNDYLPTYVQEISCEDELARCDQLQGMCPRFKIIRRKCKETCGLCRAQAPPDCRLSRHGCCWDNETHAKSAQGAGCPVCHDKYDDCKFFSQKCHLQDIRRLCPVTCHVNCYSCNDSEHQEAACPMYKQFGFCHISPELMQKICARTCGFCKTPV